MHSQMVGLMRDGLIPAPNSDQAAVLGDRAFGVKVVSLDVPDTMESARTYLCRLHVENAGDRGWLPHHREHQARVVLAIFVDGRRTQTLEVTQDVHRGGRWHFVFEVTPPADVRRFHLRLQILGEHQQFSESLGPIVVSKKIAVERAPGYSRARGSFLRRYLDVVGEAWAKPLK